MVVVAAADLGVGLPHSAAPVGLMWTFGGSPIRYYKGIKLLRAAFFTLYINSGRRY